MKAMRPLDKVCEAVLSVIPDDFPGKQYLKIEFDKAIESAAFTAPENMRTPWAKATQALVVHVGNPEPGTWKEEVAKIFNNVVDYASYLEKK